ncbi:matrixin family metalloprotease [Mangrovimicrobium sediminis]|uniref:Matrixin family metalloprotease n=2 Tax=Mangrovimicrobium sediminis TaxID=2562682 RepID=A0A4Z0M5H8_9GAMM|nr:matrixin family metalloprotease [Haliea sp. SAOS-164]
MIAGLVLPTLLSACAGNDSKPDTPPDDGVQAGADLPIGTPRAAASKQVATAGAVNQAYAQLSGAERAIAERWRGRSFEEFERQVPREAGTGYYVVNGDIVIADIKHLREFYTTKVQQAVPVRAGLAVHMSGGQRATWSAAQKGNLTYCVSDSFGSRKAGVVAAMSAATTAWEREGAVNFIHDAQQDGNCNAFNPQVVFDVRPVNNQSYLARAFFPDDPRGRRNVLIDSSSFDLDPGDALSLEGILRHELGHTLGFRHEHTRPEAGTCFEDENWEPLTGYDAFSVMHYPQCNGRGDWSLTLTDKDKAGIACLYGAGPGFNGDMSLCLDPPVPAPLPDDECGPITRTESGSIAQGAEVRFGPFQVKPGSAFNASMTGSGDPDLYVRFDSPPQTSPGAFDCRPFLSGPNESCELVVPMDVQAVHVMVRGYTAGQYQLELEFSPR